MKYWVNLFALILLLSVGACSKEEIITDESTVSIDTEITEIAAIIGELQCEDSRTSVTMGDFNSSSIKLVWAEKDTIGIYPTEGDQLSFPIVEGVGTNKCSFNGGGWALKTSSSYKAYSPFNRSYYLKKNSNLPVSMLRQKQVGNGNSGHLSKYDLQIAEGKTPASGKISFDFKHQVCFIRMDLVSPMAAVWKSITLESNALFTTEASMNLSTETPTLTPTSTAHSVTLELENVTTDFGETITAYMVVLPVNFTDKNLNIILTDSNGKNFKTEAVIANDYRSFKAGYARWIKANDFPSEIPYLTFTANAKQTFTMSKAVETLEYSVNEGEWKELGTNIVTFGGNNGNLRLRGRSKIGTASGTSSYSTIKFGNSTEVNCSGDIRTLIDYTVCKTAYIKSIPTGNARFCYLFKDCTVLKSSPTLLFTNLADYCFYHMFHGCSNLTTAPKLPSQFLTIGCYAYMFYNNSNLITPPELPATDLAAWCYQCMFYGCEKLPTAPELPATNLKTECYKNMFTYCSSLITTPKLPAWKLATSCYARMFSSCTNLTNAPELPATLLSDYCYDGMFANCKNLSIAPNLPATALADYCYSFMFQNTAIKNAPQLPATVLKRGCYQAMFSGCKNLTTAPQLFATELNNVCYERMFENCSNLSSVTMLATNISAYNSLSNWLSNVSSSGTFIKAKSMTTLPKGNSGIPTGWTVKDHK